jgi:hypothetical protein
MCGSATHPGGGIMGANGRIASQVMLKDWKKAARAAKSNGSKARSPNPSDTKSNAAKSGNANVNSDSTASHDAASQKAGH